MSRTLKVTGNHVMYDRGAWFLRVIMSSSCALCCLPSVTKQKHDFQVYVVDRARHRKSSWRLGLTNTKRSTKVAKELFATWKRKNWENLRKRKTWHKLWKHFMSKRELIRSMYNKTIIRFGFCDISRIIKVSVRVLAIYNHWVIYSDIIDCILTIRNLWYQARRQLRSIAVLV